MVYAEIISVGSELLIGKTVNTNASWLAGRLTQLGFCVRRITCVGDNLHDISLAVRESLSRSTPLVIITGGLGPTFDDMTLRGVAEALNLPLEVSETALEWVKRKYEELGLPLTPARLKMANMPKGSVPLENKLGAAPGVLLRCSSSTILCLPGVPREMMQLFESAIELIATDKRRSVYRDLSVLLASIPESSLAPIIDEVMKKHPGVYIKSHPKGSEAEPLIEAHLSTWVAPDKVEGANQQLISAKNMLVDLVEKSGGKLVKNAEVS